MRRIETVWNPWHGCRRYSEGCLNCYVYRRDESVGRDPGRVTPTADRGLPLARKRGGSYRLSPGTTVYTCMTSDFFIEEADPFRTEAWRAVKTRPDLSFLIFTKRIARVGDCLPEDWGPDYSHVTIVCTVENQKQCDIRLPILRDLPIFHKQVCCEPLLSDIDFGGRLSETGVERVIAGGESGPSARICRFDWILSLRAQCLKEQIPFYFKQTGYRFEKDGRLFLIPRNKQLSQARRAGLDL